MKIIQDLIDSLETALDLYEYNKTKDIELDDDTKAEVIEQIQYFFKNFKMDAEELDENIDTIIEQMNEPSDNEVYNDEYETMRYKEMR